MTFSPPLITIGMTSFYAQDTIGRAIESAIAQDYSNKEILIVDDASQDQSVEIIIGSLKKISYGRLIVHEKNTGFAGALNTIILNAKGEFLAIFDDDDVSHPQRLSRQVERIIEYEKASGANLVLCHSARIQTYENGFQRYEKTIGDRKKSPPHGRAVAERILTGNIGKYGNDIVGSCANCARMGRTETFRRFDGFDATMRRAEDTDFAIRFALGGGHFVGISDPLVHQTMTGGEEKSVDAEEIAETKILKKHEIFLQEIGWFDFVESWMKIRYAYFRGERLKMLFLMSTLFFKSPRKFVKKIIWSIPASDTRNAYKNWHNGKFKNKNCF